MTSLEWSKIVSFWLGTHCFMCRLVVDTVQLKITLHLLGKTHFSKMPVLCFCLYNCTITRSFLSRVVSFCGAGIWREENWVTLYRWGGTPSQKWKTPLWRELLRVFIAQDNKAGVDLSKIIKLAPKALDCLFLCHFCVYISNSRHWEMGKLQEGKKGKHCFFRVIAIYFNNILVIVCVTEGVLLW